MVTKTIKSAADAVYIHIPFCKKICHYCAFNKYFYDGQPVDQYLKGLDTEIEQYNLWSSTKPMDTIYVGGGTPSCLSESELVQLFDTIRRQIPFDEHTEFTFEINPGELSLEKCHLLREAGVNRISMGVQTFNDTLLRRIGRNHRVKHVYQSIEWFRQVGFENLSIDLIFRLPGQTLADFDDSLTRALELELPHYSLYSLIIEQQTLFQQLMREGKLPLPSEDVDADMFSLAIDRLADCGIQQYEVSNFAATGFQSRHNLKYWQYNDYYGFGAGAHGLLKGERYYNYGPVHHYLRETNSGNKPVINRLSLDLSEQMEEYIFLALRTNRGFSLNDFHAQFQQNGLILFGTFFKKQQQKQLLTIEGDTVRLTTRGLFLADTVFRELIGWLKQN